MNRAVIIITLFFFTAQSFGCATRSDNISGTYVSPIRYQNYNCDQINEEMDRLGHKVAEIAGAQDATATKDAVAMTVGVIVFWPALFFLAGGDKKEELARLKGEYDALESAAIQNQCAQAIETAKALKDAKAQKAERMAEAKEKRMQGDKFRATADQEYE